MAESSKSVASAESVELTDSIKLVKSVLSAESVESAYNPESVDPAAYLIKRCDFSKFTLSVEFAKSIQLEGYKSP